MGRAKQRWGCAVLAAVVLAVGACSSDGDSSSSTTTQPDDVAATPTTEPRGAAVGVPTAAGPVEGGRYGVPYNVAPADLLDQYGYSESEWFLSGEATAYVADGRMRPDGEWAVTAGDTAPFTTRILVRRPADDADFSGTVVVEWLNVSAGRDSDPDFGFLHPRLLAEGDAYVGVSAQATGVEGGGAALEVPGVPEVALLPLQQWDPERYAELDHPGDDWSYDIFSQAAQVVRRPGEIDPLDGLVPTQVLGVGESQSAGRLATYVNAVHPVAGIFDGFLIHSRGDSSSALNAEPTGATPEPVLLRTDLDVPVLQFETETDLIGLGHLAARQEDSEGVVTWEVAGTAHADRSTIDYGAESGRVWLDDERSDPTASCGEINDGPQAEVLRAAFVALQAWVADGTPPPVSPRIETQGDELVRDEVGNVLGGIRTPAVDAPVSALTGSNPSESVFCSLFGAATALTPAQLAARYDDHEDYVEQVTASADAAVADGFLLAEDRDALVAEAEAAEVP
jgi:hypothetical protein